MIKLCIVLTFLLALVIPSSSQTPPVLGAWRQESLRWIKAPAELHEQERSAEAALLYFGSDHRFALVYGTINQGTSWETLSHGDGQTVYLGTWVLDGPSILIDYQMVSKTFLREGDSLPGPKLKKTIQLRKRGDLLFDTVRFTRDTRLDDQLLAVLRGESASRGRKGSP
jgi:hypothetical protein